MISTNIDLNAPVEKKMFAELVYHASIAAAMYELKGFGWDNPALTEFLTKHELIEVDDMTQKYLHIRLGWQKLKSQPQLLQIHVSQDIITFFEKKQTKQDNKKNQIKLIIKT